MAALNSKFDILRGWPNSSAVAEDFVIGATGAQSGWTHPHAAGTWVTLANTTDGSMKTVDGAAASAFGTSCFLVIEGADDYSSRFSNRVTCLLGGGYVVRVPQSYNDADGNAVTCLNTAASTFAPGDLVKVVGNALTKVTVAALDIVIEDGLNAGDDAVDTAGLKTALDGLGANAIQLAEREKAVGIVMAVNSSDNTIDVYVH